MSNALDDFIEGKHDPMAPFNRGEFECEYCGWNDDTEPQIEEILIEDEYVEFYHCPECSKRFEM